MPLRHAILRQASDEECAAPLQFATPHHHGALEYLCSNQIVHKSILGYESTELLRERQRLVVAGCRRSMKYASR